MSTTFTSILESAGLPAPQTEYRFAPPRCWRFDYAWPDHHIALEIEGGIWAGGRHVRGKGYENDCTKYNTAALLGWRVLRVTTGMVNDGRALDLLQEAFSTITTTSLAPTSAESSHHVNVPISTRRIPIGSI